MKIVVAPDSFKGCLRSSQVCEHISKGILTVMPDAKIFSIPLADGGEGTTEAAVNATAGQMVKIATLDPLGRQITGQYGIMGNGTTAVMEMATASGLELLGKNELDPLTASTYGTGIILRLIIDQGIRNIIIGIGGSATNDGGAGMAQALGYKFLDGANNPLPAGIGGGQLKKIAAIDCSAVIPQLKACHIKVACDVTNPLTGSNGATAVYGSQKGATPHNIKILDQALSHFANLLKKYQITDTSVSPGDGAAGGLGFGLRTLARANMVSGAKLMIETTGLRKLLPRADYLITGEGCTDRQTVAGKLCSVVADTAAEYHVPTILLSGAVLCSLDDLQGKFKAAFSITDRPLSLEQAIAAAATNLEKQTANIINLLNHD